jgi:hypothetical protein
VVEEESKRDLKTLHSSSAPSRERRLDSEDITEGTEHALQVQVHVQLLLQKKDA